MIKFITISLLFLKFSVSLAQTQKESNINQNVYLSFKELDSTTVIHNFYTIDSISIKGKWDRLQDDGIKRHSILLKNNDTIVGFFPYPKAMINYITQKSSDRYFLDELLKTRHIDWQYMGVRHRIISSKPGFYTIYRMKKSITLIGIKGKNTYIIDYLEPKKTAENSKTEYLINFFNEIK